MDLLGVQKDIDGLKALLSDQQTKIAALESKIAEDVNQIADKVIGAISPKIDEAATSINTLTVTASNAIEEVVNSVNAAVALAKRGITVNWGPEKD